MMTTTAGRLNEREKTTQVFKKWNVTDNKIDDEDFFVPVAYVTVCVCVWVCGGGESRRDRCENREET